MAMSEYLYGRQCVREVLAANRRSLKALLLAEGLRPAPILRDIERLAEQRGVPVRHVSRQELGNISAQNRGVALEAGPYPYVQLDEELERLGREPAPLVLALDCLQDPQNLATLLRSAEGAGVGLVVIPERRQAGITPAVSHASAGAVEHLRVADVVNLRRALEQVRAAGLMIYGLERAPGSRPHYEADLRRPLAIVVGGEAEGLRRLTRETCDLLLEIPMSGKVTSLNAAVAGSLVLYEALRQRLGDRSAPDSVGR